MSPVVDKYVPVDTTVHDTSPVWPTLVGGWLAVSLLILFSPGTLRALATFDEKLAPAAVTVLGGVADASDALGFTTLRDTLEAWSAPLDDTGRVLARQLGQLTGGTVVAELPPLPPPEPSTPPGERWQAQAEHGRVHRILVVGASSIQYALGTELERELTTRYEDLAVERKGKVSTGLTRPDVFDWPGEIAKRMDTFHPDVVIGQFGGNDGQNILTPEGKPFAVYTDGWKAEYQRRLTKLATTVSERGARLIILGMPDMKEAGFDKKMRWVNEVTREAIEGAGQTFVPTEPITRGPDGNYREGVTFGRYSGRLRMDDGVHLSRLGGQFVAWHLVRRLEQDLLLVPRGPVDEDDTDDVTPTPPAVMHHFTVPSAQRGDTPLLAYVPRDVPTAGLPVWFLLHGAYDDLRAWPAHAHDALAQLAADERMIVVVPDGEAFGYWLDSPIVPTHQIATWFFSDLVPFVDRTLPSNGVRAISGQSMGGHGALTLALAHPDQFVAATSMSGAVDLTRTSIRKVDEWLGVRGDDPAIEANWTSRSALHLLRADPRRLDGVALMLTCGDDDKTWWGPNGELHALLDTAKVAHTWDPVDGGHTWTVWTEALPRHAAFVGAALGAVREP